jgi:hypothetical protein
VSLHVLDLLAELLDHGLEVEPDAREGDVVCLGAERVGLRGRIPGPGIEAAADGAAVVAGRGRIRVGAQPVEFLADVGRRRSARFLVQARRISPLLP